MASSTGGGPAARRKRLQVARSGWELLCDEAVHQLRSRYEDDRQTVSRLEEMGLAVGMRLVERHSVDRPRFAAPLDVMKYVAKDIWTELFDKQVDKLQTNYKGVYVFHCGHFPSLVRLASLNRGDAEVRSEGALQTAFSCGVIRGALAGLGLSCTVKCEVGQLPACSFTVVEKDAATAAVASAVPASVPTSTVAPGVGPGLSVAPTAGGGAAPVGAASGLHV